MNRFLSQNTADQIHNYDFFLEIFLVQPHLTSLIYEPVPASEYRGSDLQVRFFLEIFILLQKQIPVQIFLGIGAWSLLPYTLISAGADQVIKIGKLMKWIPNLLAVSVYSWDAALISQMVI